MNFWNITYEKVEELLKQKEIKEKELEELKKTTIETLWINDLDSFIEELDKYEKQEEEDRLIAEKLNKNKNGKIEKKRRKKKNEKENDKSKAKVSKINSDNTSESDISFTSNEGKKKRNRKKKEEKDEKNKKKGSKNKKVIFEESDEEKKESETNIDDNTNGKDTNISGNDINSISSGDNKSMFKMPLMERLKKRNMKIDGMSSFKLTNFGKKAKRDGLSDLSDIEFDFNDKDKFI